MTEKEARTTIARWMREHNIPANDEDTVDELLDKMQAEIQEFADLVQAVAYLWFKSEHRN